MGSLTRKIKRNIIEEKHGVRTSIRRLRKNKAIQLKAESEGLRKKLLDPDTYHHGLLRSLTGDYI